MGHGARAGGKCDGGACGHDAAAASGSPFALVLSDLMMPGVDGFELAERIRRAAELAGAAVILLSSADSQHDAARCRRAGVAAYLTKPVKQSELLDAILTALDPSTEERKAEMIGRSSQAAAEHALPITAIVRAAGRRQRHQPVAGRHAAREGGHTVSIRPTMARRRWPHCSSARLTWC